MSTGFNPYYQGSSGITAKISGGRLIDSPTIGDLTAGASYYFDGTDDKVQVADAAALSIIEQGTDGSWAVEVFFRADDGAASSDRLVSKGTDEYSFGLSDCSIDGSTITYPTAMDNSSYADQWMHLMLVGNGSLMEQFINGVSQGTTDCTASGVEGSAALRFGLETNDSGDFNGEICRVRLFNDALTDDEVRILYNGGAVPQDRQDELVGEWLSSGVTSTVWADSSGGGYDGAVTNATAINHRGNYAAGGMTVQDNIVMANGKGIDFKATADATGKTSELLNDYEEGTWTPVLSDGTNNATMSGSSRGLYTKVGRLVTVNGYAVISSLGSVSESVDFLRITGLPFPADDDHVGGGAAGHAQGLNITAGHMPVLRAVGGESYLNIHLWDATTGPTDILSAEWSADGGVTFTISYEV